MAKRAAAIPAEFRKLSEACKHFALFEGATTSATHIKPLHWYVASRLVIEGGFRPREIYPRPPIRCDVDRIRGNVLSFDPSQATGAELKVLGGLKTKNVDIVVVKENVGPVLAISCKGMIASLRNLTNRMEEFVGECTNLHIAYPPLVIGFLFLLRGYRTTDIGQVLRGKTKRSGEPRLVSPNDVAFNATGEATQSVRRFEHALLQISGRKGVRNDVSRYEATALTIVEPLGPSEGTVNATYPADPNVRLDNFFTRLYEQYDERYVYAAPGLKGVTARLAWAESSPAFAEWDAAGAGYEPRLAAEPVEDEGDEDEEAVGDTI